MTHSNQTLSLLKTRRSASAKTMIWPGPDNAHIQEILTAGLRVPDHGKLGPWRVIVFGREAQEKLTKVSYSIFMDENPDATDTAKTIEEGRFLRAPCLMCVISSPIIPHKIPEWEQVLSVGAVCQNILVASHAIGFGAQWLTEWPAYHNGITEYLQLGEHEKIAGFIYIGTPGEAAEERQRPSVSERVTFL